MKRHRDWELNEKCKKELESQVGNIDNPFPFFGDIPTILKI